MDDLVGLFNDFLKRAKVDLPTKGERGGNYFDPKIGIGYAIMLVAVAIVMVAKAISDRKGEGG